MSSFFRFDIQVLRGFAVLLVLANHFAPLTFPNGFIGVDIFFVISGYVISSSVVSSNQSFSGFSKLDFFWRRIIRLYPTLLIVLLSTSLLLILFTLTSGGAIRAALASLFGVSNIYFLATTFDYYGSIALLNPFLHTWSLGVEQQFYLLFPFFFFFLWRLSSKLLFLLVFILGLLSLFVGLIDFNLFFYLPFTRIWEFLLGTLACKYALFSQKAFSPYIQIFCFLLFLLLSVLGHLPLFAPFLGAFIGFVYLLFPFTYNTHLPSYKYVLKPLLIIGTLSYSLYLWHWPLLSFGATIFGLSAVVKLVVLGFTFGFSFFTYNFVEKRLSFNRFRAHPYTALFYSFAASLISASSLLVVASYTLRGLLFSPSARAVLEKNLPAYSGFSACSDNTFFELNSDCRIFSSGSSSSTVYLVGDSHALHLSPALKPLSADFPFNTIISTQSGIPFPPLLMSRSSYAPKKSELNLYANQVRNYDYLLANLKSRDIVLISNYSQRYFGLKTELNSVLNFTAYDSSSQVRLSRPESFQAWYRSLNRFVQLAAIKNVKVVFVLPTPEVNNSFTLPGQCIPRSLSGSSLGVSGCSYSKKAFMSSYDSLTSSVTEMTRNYPRNFFLFDPLAIFCDHICSIYNSVDNNLILSDVDHLSVYGAMKLQLPLQVFLRNLNNF